MKLNYQLFIICFLLFTIKQGIAQTSAPKYSNEFLNIGVGAKSLGMGNATIASNNNVTAGYWNPSNLLFTKHNMEIGIMHSEYFAGIAKYDYLGFSKQIDDKSAFGISVIRFGVDDIPNTTELIDKDGNVDYDRISYFSSVDYGFLGSYARKDVFIEGLSLGGNFKVVHRKIGDFASALGFGIDAAANYRTEKWKFAAILRDVTTTVNSWKFNISDEVKAVFDSTNNEIPQNSTELTIPRLIAGASRNYNLSDKFNILAEIDLDVTFDGKRNSFIRSNAFNISPNLGVELNYNEAIYFRTGINNMQWIQQIDNSNSLSVQPNIGVGIKIKNFYLDYALTNIGNKSFSLYSNIFSLRYGIK